MDNEKTSPNPTAEGDQPVEAELAPKHRATSDREIYNVVTDTVAGPNIRLRDNLFQAAAIFICAVLGALIAWIVWRGPGEAIAGAFVGLIVGLFGSGIFLMIYRAVRHISGKHD